LSKSHPLCKITRNSKRHGGSLSRTTDQAASSNLLRRNLQEGNWSCVATGESNWGEGRMDPLKPVLRRALRSRFLAVCLIESSSTPLPISRTAQPLLQVRCAPGRDRSFGLSLHVSQLPARRMIPVYALESHVDKLEADVSA
jgi:hypothetical protein